MDTVKMSFHSPTRPEINGKDNNYNDDAISKSDYATFYKIMDNHVLKLTKNTKRN